MNGDDLDAGVEAPGWLADGWAYVETPAWLWGGRPRELFRTANFQLRNASHGAGLLIRPTETYSRTRPDLIQFARIAGAGVRRENWEFLDSMADDETLADVRSEIAPAIQQLDRDAPGLLPMTTFYQALTSAIGSDALVAQSKIVLESLREVTFSDTSESVFPAAGVYAVRRSSALLHRVKLISVLLRVQHDPRLQAGDLAGLQATQQEGRGNIFASSSGLHMGYYLLDQYMGPMLGCLTPGVWGFMGSRGHGPVIFSFGRAMPGSSGSAPELLRTLATRGSSETTHFADIDAEGIPSAIAWWTGQLNELFGVITDPSVFSDANGVYQPALHLQTVLTVEQIFSRVLSIQAAHHDTNARRVLLFTVMDSVESLTGRPIEKNCEFAFAHKTLDRLRSEVPMSAQPVLLPRAEAAVRALHEVQRGFFLVEDDGTVLLRPSRQQRVPAARAAAEYLRLLRNATHGHGAIKDGAIEATESLLARHDGEIPHGVGLLGWLYLLDLISRPTALRRHLTSRSRKYRPPI